MINLPEILLPAYAVKELVGDRTVGYIMNPDGKTKDNDTA